MGDGVDNWLILTAIQKSLIHYSENVSYDYNLPFSYFVNFDSCRKKYQGRDSNSRPHGYEPCALTN